MDRIPLPKSLKLIKKEKNSYEFVLEPLYPGYGATIGNSLRRILLSSLPGASVTGVKVKGVDHEFSTLNNVKEDMVEVILNLKLLSLKSHSAEPVRLNLKVKGDKEVKASMIEKNDQVEIANPDLHILTLDGKNAEVDLELVVEQGRGYVPVEAREEERIEIGMIAIDAIYSPVRNVNYEVENVRVGKMTNYDKLTISITTDGTMDGTDAMKQASEIAIDHFKTLVDRIEGEDEEDNVVEKVPELAKLEEEGQKNSTEDIADKAEVDEDLLSLNLSRRSYNALLKNGIKNVSGFKAVTQEDLENMQGVGEKSMQEILNAIKQLNE